MAHVTALAAARHRVLADRGWSVEDQGLAGSPPIRVLVGEHHETLLRALRHLGIGTDAVVRVTLTADGLLLIQTTEINGQDLIPKLLAIAAERRDNKVFLRADGAIPYERVQ